MNTYYTKLLSILFLLFSGTTCAIAQHGDQYLKLGGTLFFLSDGRDFNHTLISGGVSYEYQISGQFSLNLNANAAQRISKAKPNVLDGYIENIKGFEVELRFYPNKQGKGFYAGAAADYYFDHKIYGAKARNANHIGSHINVGFQYPLGHNFYLQTNGQIGVYGKGFSTIARYGINVMAGKRF